MNRTPRRTAQDHRGTRHRTAGASFMVKIWDLYSRGNCEVYGEIRQKYGSIKDDKTMVEFFNEVLAMRDLLEDK